MDGGVASAPAATGAPAEAILSVWIVNYDSTRWLARALAGLTSDRIRSIVVLDNASAAAERAELRLLAAARPDLRVLWSEVNLGFGAGHNHIADTTRPDAVPGELIWLLNPDTVVDEAAVQALCSVLEQGRADLVSPVILTGRPDRPTIWFAGGAVDRRAARVNPVLVGRGREAIPAAPLLPSPFLTGAALFLARSTFDRLGGFRADLFLYWEDADLDLRAAGLGLRLSVVTGAVIWHAEGGSSRPDAGAGSTAVVGSDAADGDVPRPADTAAEVRSTPRTSATAFYYTARNRILVCAPPHRGLALVIGWGAPYLIRLIAAAALSNGRGRRSRVWAILRGTADGLRGRTGSSF